ncbi:YjgP/YjgQ family permease [Cryomorpha ignava]|uniref:YjgP/YjgQ family permease n=1 Tax=Cryomorpha ignava TaxID=101383 RepID=A0A7K3WWU9_9FLAO|nr:LptF/LptG family permease [Cryomorpha ignava]NEN25332.1 YjgP/YjgQ family permease [Cryomorpha ignava]
MKKIHSLIIKSYLGPFFLTLGIVMFILLMQFVWKYIDDFMGKGLDYWVIAELLLYASANLVSLALPLAVLLSSIMTFGGMAEHYELVAMKSSGLSLIRIMLPLIIFICLLSGGAFYFNNTIAPLANLKFKSLLWDVTHTKPSLELKEGVFYNGIDGYSIRVSEKDRNSNMLHDLLIYQHDKKNPGNRTVIRAKQGEMLKTTDGRYMSIHLMDGVSYDEVGAFQAKNHPMIKSTFDEDYIMMDLSGFDMQRTDEDLWKNHMKMLSMEQLSASIDSLQKQKDSRKTDFLTYMEGSINLPDSLVSQSINLNNDTSITDTLTAVNFQNLATTEQRRVVNVALNITRNAKNYMNRTGQEMENREEYIDKHKIEWHRKLTLSFACFVLFFIGAPLGAIIKKGGLGMPVIFSVIFFLIFHITSITGEKLIESGKLEPFTGMWLSSMVLFPIALFLTYKAVKDAALFDRDTYSRLTDKITALFTKNKIHQV